MFADRQSERHFAVTLVAVVFVDRHGRPSLVIWDRSADPVLTNNNAAFLKRETAGALACGSARLPTSHIPTEAAVIMAEER